MARKRSSLLNLAFRPTPYFTGVVHTLEGPIKLRDCGDHLLFHQDGEEWTVPVIQPTLEQIVGKEKAAQIRAARGRRGYIGN